MKLNSLLPQKRIFISHRTIETMGKEISNEKNFFASRVTQVFAKMIVKELGTRNTFLLGFVDF